MLKMRSIYLMTISTSCVVIITTAFLKQMMLFSTTYKFLSEILFKHTNKLNLEKRNMNNDR